MPRAAKSIKVLEYGCHLNQIIAHPDHSRYLTVGFSDVKMFSLQSNRHLMDFEQTEEGQILTATLFNDDILVAVLTSKEFCFWSLHTGKLLRRIKEEKLGTIKIYTKIHSLNGEHFMVTGKQKLSNGFRSKAILIDFATDSAPHNPEQNVPNVANVVAVCTSFGHIFKFISTYQNRFVTGGRSKTAEVWAVENGKFRLLKVLRPRFTIQTVCLDEKYIFVSASAALTAKENVNLYDAKNFRFIRAIASSVRWPSFASINSDWLVFVYAEYIELLLALDIRQGREVWRVELKNGLCPFSIIVIESQLLVVASGNRVLTCPLPEALASEVRKSRGIEQSAFLPRPHVQNVLLGSPSEQEPDPDLANSSANVKKG